MPPKIEPKTLKGFRDIPPGEVLAREKIINTIKDVYESYGFSPLATPALEYKETLLGYGEEASKQIYLFRDPDGSDVGLRFDLTVPLCRYVSAHRDLPRPFKRYQIQPVWRYDKPDPGRFREFLQFDIDTVGSASMAADAEIISAMHDSLGKLGLKFKIRFSNRKVLNSLIKYAGLPEKAAHSVFRVMDKLEKQGLEAVKLELGPGRIDTSGDKIKGLGFKPEQIQKIEEFLNLKQGTRKEALESVTNLFRDVSGAEEGIKELEQIGEFLTATRISDEKAGIDLSIARGLEYYTGPVFEAILPEVKDFGSVMGGGRYDDLIEKFTGESIPATGVSMGIDRLFSALQSLKLTETKPSTAEVLVTVMVKERLNEYQKMAKMLREAGFKTELYVGSENSISNQLKYADKLLIPVAVIMGKKEFESGQVSIKDLDYIRKAEVNAPDRGSWLEQRAGQKTIASSELVSEIRKILGRA